MSRRLLWHLASAWRSDRSQAQAPGKRPPGGAVLMVVDSGSGWLELAGGRWRLECGAHCYLYNLRDERGMRSDRGKPLLTRGMVFCGASLRHWLSDLGAARRPVFDVADPAALRESLGAIARRAARQCSGWEIAVHRDIGGILESLLQFHLPHRDADRPLPPRIASLVEAVEADPERPWTAQEMAELAAMSSSAFRARFRAALQMSVREYLLAVKLNAARNLLCDPSLRIKEVAERLQFSSEAHFSRFFSRQTGSCPKVFRELATARHGGRGPSRHAVRA